MDDIKKKFKSFMKKQVKCIRAFLCCRTPKIWCITSNQTVGGVPYYLDTSSSLLAYKRLALSRCSRLITSLKFHNVMMYRTNVAY